jgi:hypothetical protein
MNPSDRKDGDSKLSHTAISLRLLLSFQTLENFEKGL